MIKVGDRYKLRNDVNIDDVYLGKLFTVIEIERDYYLVQLDGESIQNKIHKNEWSGLVTVINSWDGNILLHRFIA